MGFVKKLVSNSYNNVSIYDKTCANVIVTECINIRDNATDCDTMMMYMTVFGDYIIGWSATH